MAFLPCFLCGNKLEKRESKNAKPYFVCDACGIQLFIRRKQGIARLEELLRASEKNALPFKQAARRIFEVQALLSEIDGTKAQIKKLDDEIGFFFAEEDKVRARNALKTRLGNLLQRFEQFCEQSES